MGKKKLAMIGAGSGFTISIAKELAAHEMFGGWEFCMMDINEVSLRYMEEKVKVILGAAAWKVKISTTTDLSKALDGCAYVVTSCEPKRYENWAKDLGIPEQFGVYQVKGENGGPGGMIHGMRNISMFMGILKEMEDRCPNEWLMNFTNPMSILCTFFKNCSSIKALGFCHQVHGSFGVIAEMLDMEPGELEVLSAGVNHLNWLYDIRKKGTGESCMDEFLEKVRKSKYWKQRFKNIPEQNFTLEALNTFNMYPVGPTYFDAINIRNNGAVTNLPDDVILDVPGIAIGGKVRSIHVGELSPGPLEICRRQTALHEMIVKATVEGDDGLAVQILCLTPYVRSVTQARNIWQAYKKEYIDYLPTFKRK